jgi:hypothetical protein
VIDLRSEVSRSERVEKRKPGMFSTFGDCHALRIMKRNQEVINLCPSRPDGDQVLN